MKLYLLSELNSKDYAYASHSVLKSYQEANEAAVSACVNKFEGNCDVEIEKQGFRITSQQDLDFYVTEIKPFVLEKGEYLLVWHHAYDGVDFEICFQGSREECEKRREEEIKKLCEELDLSFEDDVIDNVVDTGTEWEVWDIVDIRDCFC